MRIRMKTLAKKRSRIVNRGVNCKASVSGAILAGRKKNLLPYPVFVVPPVVELEADDDIKPEARQKLSPAQEALVC